MALSNKQILWGLILVYIIIFGIFVSFRHYNFQTQTWDLAPFVQSFWNTVNGNIMANNLEQAPNHLGLHWSPILLLLTPFYAIWASPYTLLWLQTIFIALGAIPLYFLAKRYLSSPWPLLLASGYLLYPGLNWANTYDFHAITLFIPLFLAALYFLDIQKWWPAIAFLILSAAVKEDTILVVMVLGIYLLIKKQEASGKRQEYKKNLKIIGGAIIVLSLIYFIIATQILMPAFGGGLLRFDRYANLGATPVEAVKNLIIQPWLIFTTIFTGPKLAYLFWLFLPVLFMPFFSGRFAILLLPGLAENLLTNYHFQFSGIYHYDSILIPIIFVGTVYGLKNILPKLPGRGLTSTRLAWAMAGAIALAFFMRSPISPFTIPWQMFGTTPHWETFREIVKNVPPDARVAAQTNLVPHLANREHVYMLGKELVQPDILLIDGTDPFGFDTHQEFENYVDNYINSGLYNVEIIKDRYLILAKK